MRSTDKYKIEAVEYENEEPANLYLSKGEKHFRCPFSFPLLRQ